MTDKHGEPFRFRTKWETKKSRCLRVLEDLSEVELAYMAGLVDGEGTISFRKQIRGHWRPILEITNTDPLLIAYLQRWFWQQPIASSYQGRVPVFRVNLTGFGIAPVLDALDRYLVIKRLQARLVRRYIALRQEQRWKTGPTPEMEGIVQDVKALNSRGSGSVQSKLAVREKYSTI